MYCYVLHCNTNKGLEYYTGVEQHQLESRLSLLTSGEISDGVGTISPLIDYLIYRKLTSNSYFLGCEDKLNIEIGALQMQLQDFGNCDGKCVLYF